MNFWLITLALLIVIYHKFWFENFCYHNFLAESSGKSQSIMLISQKIITYVYKGIDVVTFLDFTLVYLFYVLQQCKCIIHVTNAFTSLQHVKCYTYLFVNL